jgi:hypothetical protein
MQITRSRQGLGLAKSGQAFRSGRRVFEIHFVFWKITAYFMRKDNDAHHEEKREENLH